MYDRGMGNWVEPVHGSEGADHALARVRRLRKLNEEVRARRDDFHDGDAVMHSVMCECPEDECAVTLDVAAHELAHARGQEHWYVVGPDHVTVGMDVLRRAATFCVVAYVDVSERQLPPLP